MTPTEVRALLAELDRRLGRDLAGFWRAIAQSDPAQFRALLVDAYPEIIAPYEATAIELGTQWYDESPSTTPYRAKPVGLAPPQQLSESALWALNSTSGEAGLTVLLGSASRTLMNGLRDTVVANAAAEPGARWVRHASANACSFCRMLCTRHVGPNATFYRSEDASTRVVGRSIDLTVADRRAIAAGLMTREEALASRAYYSDSRAAAKVGRSVGEAKLRRPRGTRDLGEKYHDNCHCLSVMVRPGGSYTPPPYVDDWNEQYIQAREAAGGDTTKIITEMDRMSRGARTR
ncbi:hypothetical protein nbrc107696_06370 [Gordonia spumicola]|uniref:Capsid maturation protease n=1 Tax=Gordonia spumicola TaxID=589161 RepID=A0A7I9V597_9ACTN|nr:hypothetical protein [Gordonia spumicola]GEE00191.1 hypothetical protein nbrc107696_06370 [Gordonia spumicola]